jgi:hypothetical protein
MVNIDFVTARCLAVPFGCSQSGARTTPLSLVRFLMNSREMVVEIKSEGDLNSFGAK